MGVFYYFALVKNIIIGLLLLSSSFSMGNNADSLWGGIYSMNLKTGDREKMKVEGLGEIKLWPHGMDIFFDSSRERSSMFKKSVLPPKFS